MREFVEETARVHDMKISWEGEGVNEVGKDQNGVIRVRVNPEFYRPNEVEALLGNPQRAKEELGWGTKDTFFLIWYK